MLRPAHPRMTVEQFVLWHEQQEGKFELIDGYPVEIDLMTGGRHVHNLVAANVLICLGPKVKSKGCRASTSDTGVRTIERQVRYPDVVVTCGPIDPDTYIPDDPVLVVEVASRSTRGFDAVQKLEEFQSVDTIQYILLVEPDFISVRSYVRVDAGWSVRHFTDIKDVVPLPSLETELPIVDIYDGLDPKPYPPVRLVDET